MRLPSRKPLRDFTGGSLFFTIRPIEQDLNIAMEYSRPVPDSAGFFINLNSTAMKTRTLIDSRLVTLLHEARNGRTISERTLDDAYACFCTTVSRLGGKPCSSGVIRLFERARIELFDLDKYLEHDPSPVAASCCQRARAVVESELKLIGQRLRYPELDRERHAVPRSPLYLNDGTTVSDIVELIAPAHKLGLFRTETGRADLKTILAGFEWLLNVDLTHYAGLRCGIFKRQELTPLLDRMREVWIDASQK